MHVSWGMGINFLPFRLGFNLEMTFIDLLANEEPFKNNCY